MVNEQERTRIGAMIRERRQELGLTLAELSKLTGLDSPHLSRIEQGKYNVTIDTLSVIATALGKQISFG